MRPDLSTYLVLIRESVIAPRSVAAELMQLRPPRAVLIEAVVLVAAIGALLMALTAGAMGTPTGAAAPGPLASAALLAASVVLTALGFQVAGRLLGGSGTFDEALLLMVWLEAVALAVQAAQALVLLILPSATSLVGVAGLALLLWCLVNFVHVLHGFEGFGRTILGIVLGSTVIALGLALLLGFMVRLGWISNA